MTTSAFESIDWCNDHSCRMKTFIPCDSCTEIIVGFDTIHRIVERGLHVLILRTQ